MLKTEWLRDGKNQIIGNITSRFANGDVVARDRDGKLLGRASKAFENTRDASGKLVSRNASDAWLLFKE
jgi:hypothetical protein